MEILKLESVLIWFRAGCDNWLVVGGLLAAVLVLNHFKWAKPYVAGFVFPVFLLLFRKVALYIPLIGTLSTDDRVIFWSTYAYIYFAILIPVHIALLVSIWIGMESLNSEGQLITFVGVFHLFGTNLLLPVDGPSLLIMPFLSHVAVAKLLLINPALLILIGIALLIHFCFALNRQSHRAQVINKLLLGALCVCGIAQFCLQPWPLSQVRAVLTVDESRPFEQRGPDVKQVEELSNVPAHWINSLGRINRCGVNFLDGPEAQFGPDCKISEITSNLARKPSNWTPQFNGFKAVFFGSGLLALLVLAGLVQKLVGRLRRETVPNPTPYYQPISRWEDIEPSVERTVLPAGKWPYLGIVITAFMFAIGIYVSSSTSIALGVIALSGLMIILQYKFLMEGLFYHTWHTMIHAVAIRDRKGRRGLSRLTRVALNGSDAGWKVMDSQPDQFLLALKAKNNDRRLRIPELQKGIELPELAAHRACTTLTRVDFLRNGLSTQNSVELLPQNLWPKALNALVNSGVSEARRVATTCANISRRRLIRFCQNDPAPKVWQAALKRLQQSLQPKDVTKLATSEHAEVRVFAVEQLPRDDVLDFCFGDFSSEVRMTAWQKLEIDLTGAESNQLIESSFADVRLNVLRKDKVSLRRLKRLRWRDPDQTVRQEAFAMVQGDVGPWTRWRMLRSHYSDVRLRMIESNRLSAAQLTTIYEQDPDEAVRQGAWKQLHQELSVEVADGILEKNRLVLRPAVVQTCQFSRERLVSLCANDWQTAVRVAAWEKLREQLTPSEAALLSCSQYAEVRKWALRSRVLPREQVVELCRNEKDRPTTMEAWQVLNDGLTAFEAERVSRSWNSDIRVKAIDSGLLINARLRELSRDWIVVVREAAQEQLRRPEYSQANR